MKAEFKSRRVGQQFAVAATVAFIISAAGCYQGVQPDPNPPRVYILKFEHNNDGTQGAQTTVNSGGQFTESADWLGANQANVRVYGDSTHGVKSFEVSGSANGTCSSNPDSHGQFFTAPSPLAASFPTYTEAAPSGTTRDFMSFTLDASVLTNNSCGHHSYNGAPPNLEYFLVTPATWTITAATENASNLKATGTFTIKLQ